MSEIIAADVRLIILKALAAEVDYTLNETLLAAEMERFGHRKSRDYVRNELRFLEGEARAVTLTEAGTVLIATITRRGLDHVERRVVLEGVKRPSPPEA
ncbi:MAG TPA: hypothetical protein PLG99_00885 [Kaistiaceae bacterium]|nr:hypothetical protein [Kaistiaceae bacterium]